MADKQTELSIAIRDEVSASAEKIVTALGDVEKQGGKATSSALNLNQGLELLSKGFHLLEGAISSVISIGKGLLDQFSEYEEASKVFELKEGEHGVEVLDQITDHMKSVGIATSEALDLATRLGREYKPEAAADLALIIEDVRANLQLGVGSTEALTDAIVKLGPQAEVSVSRLKKGSILERAFGGKDIATEISKATGKSLASIQTIFATKGGKVSGVDLLKGLAQAQLELGHTAKIGAAAEAEALKSLPKQLEVLESSVKNFGAVFGKELFGGNSLPESIHNMSLQIDKFLADPKTQKGIHDLAEGFKDAAKWIGEHTPAAIDVLTSVFNGFIAVADGVKESLAWITTDSDSRDAAIAVLEGAIFALTAAFVLYAPAAIAAAIPTIALASPFILLAAAVGTTIFAIEKVTEAYKAWQSVKGDKDFSIFNSVEDIKKQEQEGAKNDAADTERYAAERRARRAAAGGETTPGTETGGTRIPEPIVAPAHAQGGTVLPAPGEMFASVAPGEQILPAKQYAQQNTSTSNTSSQEMTFNIEVHNHGGGEGQGGVSDKPSANQLADLLSARVEQIMRRVNSSAQASG